MSRADATASSLDAAEVAPGAAFRDVSALLAPSSIAVIGASDEPANLGGSAVRLLQKFGFPGPVWPVHPRHATVAGLECFASVEDLPEPADLAIVAVAAERVTGVVLACGAAGIEQGIVWAGGFAEVGPDGAELQRQLTDVCAETAFSLLGPNCLGVINTALPMTATFASFLVEEAALVQGDISIVGQSGGLVTMAQALAQDRGFGFRFTVSTGNEAVLGVADFVHAFAHDPGTRVIAAYLEGTRDGAKLLAALRGARAAGKPIVVLKGGSTAASAQAAAAHTGALAGESRVWSAVLRDHAIEVGSLEELLDVCLHLSGTGGDVLPGGDRAAVVTFGGGSGVLSADQCAAVGLRTPRLSTETRGVLAALVPATASTANPVDLTPVTYMQPEYLERFPAALDTIGADQEVDAVLVQCGPMARGAAAVADAICDFTVRSPKTVCLSWPLAPAGVPEQLRARGMHVFDEYARAIRVVGKLAAYACSSAQPGEIASEAHPPSRWDELVPDPVPGLVVSEHDCHRILAAAGLPVAAARFAASEDGAAEAGETVGWPVAMKGSSPEVTHRAAAGLVELDVTGAEGARAAHRRLVGRAAELGVSLDGVYVQHMEEGAELLVSAFRDATFGVVVTCGAGGVLTETLDDIALELAPFGEERAAAMLGRLGIVRGMKRLEPPADTAPVAALLAAFSRLAAKAPWRRFVLELNPVKWHGDRVVAVDGLLIVEEP